MSNPVSPARAARRPPGTSQPARRPALRQPSPEGGAAPERKQKPTKICWELPTIDQNLGQPPEAKKPIHNHKSAKPLNGVVLFSAPQAPGGRSKRSWLTPHKRRRPLALPQPLRAFGSTSFGGSGRLKRPRSQRQQARRLAMRQTISHNPFACSERVVVEPDGIEPTTCSLQSYRSPN